MPLLSKEISYVLDVIDEKYIHAIRKSALHLFNSYIEFEGNNLDNKPEVNERTISFWASLGAKTFKELQEAEFKIYILPLHRVGASEGNSGSKVFVTYLSFQENENDHSNPFILKFQDLSADATERDKLKEEMAFANAIKPFVGANASHFAFPVLHQIVDNVSILWSLFSSAVFSKMNNANNKIELKEDNLWKAFEKLELNCKDKQSMNKITNAIHSTYNVLLPMHRGVELQQPKKKVILKTEYASYLRGKDSLLEKNASHFWGKKNKQKIKDFGEKWTNPLYVFKLLENYEATITLGSIHGDLHTKNIIFGTDSALRIIDFGWSQVGKHIAKDYVLLESNLRFMILHPGVPFEDVQLLCNNLLKVEEKTDSYKCDYSKFIHSRIYDIREKALDLVDRDKIFDEYLIPLFFLTLGLIKFSKSFNNIISLRLTILHLSKLIEEHLNKNNVRKS